MTGDIIGERLLRNPDKKPVRKLCNGKDDRCMTCHTLKSQIRKHVYSFMHVLLSTGKINACNKYLGAIKRDGEWRDLTRTFKSQLFMITD